jgi:ribonuclease HI
LFDDDSVRPGEVTIFCDGGARGNPGPAAIGAVVFDTSSDPPRRLAAVSERIGETTNNVAEYRALIAGLEAALPFAPRLARVRVDSMLVVQQVRGEWKVRQEHLRPLHRRARELLSSFEAVDIRHVRREENTDADALVNAALDASPASAAERDAH